MTTLKPEDIEFLAERTLELMGGRESAIASMEAEYEAMKERWNQDTHLIGRILRSHLHVEYYLTEHLQCTNPGIADLDEARLTFSQKVKLLKPDTVLVASVIGGIRHLNKIRNRLAHNLAATVTEEDAAVFLSQSLFRATRDIGVKEDANNPPTNDPIDVLEAFAEYASAALHSGSTQHSKALQQAISELDAKSNGVDDPSPPQG